MAGRQVGKSLGISVRGALSAGTTGYFNIVYAFPSANQAEYFSNNYFRPTVNNSVFKGKLIGKDAVLQRDFDNGSSVFFRYIGDSADRARGLSVSGGVFADECVHADSIVHVRRAGEQNNQPVRVADVRVGDHIRSFDKAGSVMMAPVTAVLDRGVRQTCRLSLLDGSSLVCTPDTLVYTNAGWSYVSDLVRDPAGVLVSHGGVPDSSSEVRSYWTSIKSIEPAGPAHVFDLTVEGTHTFFADGVGVHNCQDHDLDCLDVLLAAMGASPYKFTHYTGTPKTTDNPMQILWDQSSQAEWAIPCGCRQENICCTSEQLLKMIGPRGLICSKCGSPLDSSTGYYLHRYSEKQLDFPGYHMPQPAFPIHYGSPVAWSVLLDALKNKPQRFWMNELLGESYDAGAKLITEAQLKEAATLEPTKPNQWVPGDYLFSAVGIDWGGKGKETVRDTEEFISNTAVALGGIRPDGRIEVKFLQRTPYSMDYTAEADLMRDTAAAAHADLIASDNGGAGDLREHVLRSSGVPAELIVPFTYVSQAANKPIVFYQPPSLAEGARGARSSYSLDKTRSLTLLIESIKRGWVLLPRYQDFRSELSDFYALYEETRDRPTGAQYRLIRRQSKKTDDVVHAINFCCMCLWYRAGIWPDFADSLVGNQPG
jgi:hypothetical protein